MDVIEYENGLPKGYLERRLKTSRLYILSMYLYCIFNLMTKFNIVKISNEYLFYIVNSCLVFISCVLLINSIIARRNYKNLAMDNFSEKKAITNKEKIIHSIIIISISVFTFPAMLIYFIIAGFVYLAINRSSYTHMS